MIQLNIAIPKYPLAQTPVISNGREKSKDVAKETFAVKWWAESLTPHPTTADLSHPFEMTNGVVNRIIGIGWIFHAAQLLSFRADARNLKILL